MTASTENGQKAAGDQRRGLKRRTTRKYADTRRGRHADGGRERKRITWLKAVSTAAVEDKTRRRTEESQ